VLSPGDTANSRREKFEEKKKASVSCEVHRGAATDAMSVKKIGKTVVQGEDRTYETGTEKTGKKKKKCLQGKLGRGGVPEDEK